MLVPVSITVGVVIEGSVRVGGSTIDALVGAVALLEALKVMPSEVEGAAVGSLLVAVKDGGVTTASVLVGNKSVTDGIKADVALGVTAVSGPVMPAVVLGSAG